MSEHIGITAASANAAIKILRSDLRSERESERGARDAIRAYRGAENQASWRKELARSLKQIGHLRAAIDALRAAVRRDSNV